MSGESAREAEERELVRKEDTFLALSNAYAFVRGQEQMRALERMTFGDVLRTRVTEIEGPLTGGLQSRLEELAKVKGDFDLAIARLRGQEERNDDAGS